MLGLVLAACHTNTSETAAPQAAAAAEAVSPAVLGDATLILDYSNAQITEIEDGTVLCTNRAARPDEFGPGNRETIKTFFIDSYGTPMIAKYTKTGPKTARVEVLSSNPELIGKIKNNIVPRIDSMTTDAIIQALEYGADGNGEYDIIFTSPTTGVAVKRVTSGTNDNTYNHILVTLIPAS